MSTHERYELLAALSAGGQIAALDQQDLESHLAQCPGCLRVLEEFRQIAGAAAGETAQGEQPTTDGSCSIESSRLRKAEDQQSIGTSQFADFAWSHGIRFSSAAERSLAGRDRYGLALLKIGYAAALLLVAAASVGLTLKLAGKHGEPSSLPVAPPASAVIAPQGKPSHETLEGRGETTELRNQLGKALNEISQWKQAFAASRKDRAVLEAELTDRDTAFEALRTKVANAERERDESQATIASLKDKNAQTLAELAEMRIRSMNLSEDLRKEKAAAEQEHELSAASKEVRDLMGARRLFMVDVYDGADTSRSNRSFGRIFYTEGKSLIFYAFDLDKVKNGKHVTFEAWAEPGKSSGGVQHLGDFYIDDVVQKRWVMKVADPEKLKAVDAIFVTVEPGKGSTKPTGTKLLYAYLGGQPNHP